MSDMYPPLPPPPAYAPNVVMTPNGPVIAMTFGQILDRVFHVFRSAVRPFLGIGVLPMLFLMVFEGLFFGIFYAAGGFPNPATLPNPPIPDFSGMWKMLVPLYVIFIPIGCLFYGLYYGASTYIAVQSDRGLRVTTMEALRHGWSRIGRYTWLIVLMTLIVALPLMVIGVIAAAIIPLLTLAPHSNANLGFMFLLIPLLVLFYLGFLVYAVIMGLRLSLAFPACLEENLTAWESIKRSGVLSNGAKGRIFLVLLIVHAIGYAAFMVLYFVGIFVAVAVGATAGMGADHHLSPLTIGIWVVLGLGVLALVLVWTALLMGAFVTTLAVFYRNQLLRKEGRLPAAAIPSEGAPA